MANDDETVFIVDDEDSVRRSLKYLLESIKLRVETFESAEALLKKLTPTAQGCIVLDVRMPGIGGPGLMDHLHQIGLTIPIIFLSSHGDVPLAVRVMRGGAIDFLQKPPSSQVLLECVRRALASDRQARQERAKTAMINQRLAALTEREREVMERLVAGQSNKAIARALDVSYKTVEAHRGRVMRKMQVSNYSSLVHLVLNARRVAGAG